MISTVLVVAGVVLVVAVIALIIFKSFYRVTPPNKVMVISSNKKIKYHTGGGHWVNPITQRVDTMSLELISVDVQNNGTSTADHIPVNIDAEVKLAIGTDELSLERASKYFLNRTPDEITGSIMSTLQANIREIVGQMSLVGIITSRQEFADKVSENVSPDIALMGLEVISFGVQSISDNSGVIEILGEENIQLVTRNSEMSKTSALRDIAVSKAVAENETNESEILNRKAIAERENELAIYEAELKTTSDIAIAKSSIAGSIEKEKQNKMLIEEEAKNKKIQADIDIELSKKRLDATIKSTADADLYIEKQKKLMELEVEVAEAKSDKEINDLKAASKIETAKATAAEIELIGNAEAESVRKLGIAEAESIREKATAMKEYGDAAMFEMLINRLPEIVGAASKPLENIGDVKIYSTDGSDKAIASVAGGVTTSLDQIMSGVGDALGLDVKQVINTIVGAKLVGKSIGENIQTVEVVKEVEVIHPTTNGDTDPVGMVEDTDELIKENTEADEL